MSSATPPSYVPSNQPQQSSGLAVASLVLGIISLVLFCVWYVSIPCAIIAIVMGAIAKGKAARGEAGGKGMATAGLVCGIIAIIIDVIVVILVLVGVSVFGPKMQEMAEEMQKMQQQQMQQQQQQMQREQMENGVEQDDQTPPPESSGQGTWLSPQDQRSRVIRLALTTAQSLQYLHASGASS